MWSNDVARQALALPMRERFALMCELQASLSAEGHAYDPVWLGRELERRRQEDAAAPDSAVSLETMRQRLAARHGWTEPQ